MKNRAIAATIQVLKSVWTLIFITVIGLSITTCASMTIVDVEWDTLEGPEKVRQFFGINNSEVKVFALYKNGERRQVSVRSLRYDKDTVGPQIVIASIGGGADGSFETEVMELIDIRIERPPSKTTYITGEQAMLSGIRVMGIWADMPDAEIPVLQLRVADFDSSAEGDSDITISYNGMNASFPVTVTARSVAPVSVPASSTASLDSTPASASAPGTTNEVSRGTASQDSTAGDEWQLMLDRINLLVDNHFENRDFSAGQNANWNMTGLSVGIYKKRQDGVF